MANIGIGEAHKFSAENFHKSFKITEIFPAPPQIELIGHLPETVKRAFLGAEKVFSDGLPEIAASQYRKTLERALKVKFPERKGMLNQRIRDLEQQNRVPHDLIQLMDAVKFLGNDAMHELEDPDPEDVVRGRTFTRLFLTYMFELPEQLKEALGDKWVNPDATDHSAATD